MNGSGSGKSPGAAESDRADVDCGVDWDRLLANHSLFAALSASERRKLLSGKARTLQRRAGETIIEAGERTTSVFFIGAGSVQVVLPRERGGEAILTPLKQGECFGEMAAIDQRPRSASVVAREDCCLLEVPGKTFLDLVEGHPNIKFELFILISNRLRDLSDAALNDRFESINQRIELFSSKLDSEKRGFDATRMATEAYLEQTRQATDDLIMRGKRYAKIFSVLLFLVGFIGAGGVVEILGYKAQLEGEVERAKGEVEAARNRLSETYAALVPLMVTAVLNSDVYISAQDFTHDTQRLMGLSDDAVLEVISFLWQRTLFEKDAKKRQRVRDSLQAVDINRQDDPSRLRSKIMIEFFKATVWAMEGPGMEASYLDTVERLKLLSAKLEEEHADQQTVRTKLRNLNNSFDPDSYLATETWATIRAAYPHLTDGVRQNILRAWSQVP